jgi:hypothetical protein
MTVQALNTEHEQREYDIYLHFVAIKYKIP